VHSNFKKILISLLFVFFFLTLPFLKTKNFILADPIDDCINNNDSTDYCLGLIKDRIKGLESAINPLKTETTDLQKKITSAKSQINQIYSQISNLNKRLTEKEKELDNQQKLLGERVRRYYKSSKKFSPFLIFLSNNEGTSLLQQYTLYQSVISQDKFMITQYTTDINSLGKNKTELETETTKLASLKKNLENRFSFLSQEITKAETYKSALTENLRQLEAKRLASLGLPTTTGSGISCVDDRTIDPGFGTGFAFFTFGIPHHVGLNQYGAYGRANAGQSYDQILRAYYNFDEYQDRGSVTIKVNNGNGVNKGSVIWTGSLQDYVKRIYEVPASWPIESLKAQAIAARSYALAVTNNGQDSICNNQYCQVFKTDPKGGQWEQAVNETSGKVMVVGGQPITAWFASTAGGYTFTSEDIWGNNRSWTKRLRDTSGDINSLDDLKAKAYDKDSPCFYSAQGYRKEYNKSAWLKPSEVADIVNAILLSQKDSSVNNNLSPLDQGGWSIDKVKEELKNKGGTVCNTVNSTSQSFDFGSGKTTQISFSCDTGTYSFDGSTFKSYFNARAPANIAIVGSLYNVEKR
jgi:SpoIID/LytB domain protein